MSYRFRPDRFYRMPTHFGPSLGPRQGLDGRRYANVETSRDVIVHATFNAEKAQLEKLLAPGFSLREPYVINFSFFYIKDVEWLAGRGYNVFGAFVPVTYKGQEDTVHGDFLVVLWGNMADPIITEREDLGFPKVYCEIPEPQFIDNDLMCRASWDGCQFASLRLSGLKDVALQDLPVVPPSDGLLHYKYIPKTGSLGEADVEYAVLTPGETPNAKIDHAMLAKSASCDFRRSSWEELPTLVHIVNTLSKLTLGECIKATLLRTHGGKDLSDQRILV